MSLRLRLVATLGITLVLLWGVMAAWLMRDVSTQIERSLDQRLTQSAHMVAGLLRNVPASALGGGDATPAIPSPEGVACRVSSLRGQVIAGTHPELNEVLKAGGEGYSYRDHNGQRWRVYTLIDDDKRISVADRVRERESLMSQMRRAALYPFLFALVGSLIVLWWGVTRGLLPLSRLQRRLSGRDDGDLSPLPVCGLPSEVRPLIDGFNTLLGRTERMLEMEQRFTDDAAHELRTPLTAIRTHLQIAGRVEGDRRRQAIQHAELGVERLTRTLDQLLMLARMESEEVARGKLEPVTIGEALEAAMNETASSERCCVNGVNTEVRAAVSGALLITALRNLLENAMRHGAPGGVIDIDIHSDADSLSIAIASQGETIPPERLARLAERFLRGSHPQGSGLGLSIVEAIVTRAGGRMTMVSGNGVGLQVTLQFPATLSVS
ncbi:sensor histidine kinase [Halomonas huangheensis]|uniref:histidine kinase n=1 Tax=Halomonas huangheensis TaxID=1178482 RepID=W1N4R9_9GAMM|nr:sensor histidine kinase [Halomonas huangheensis]ALM51465.1 hypothetical protein AR456_03515 [Halomonas huangheensis]ERL49920.1 hypothetical protein BJB45_02005 [Halomonas huangheensis]